MEGIGSSVEMGSRVAEELRSRLGMRGVLVKVAERGQMIELRCEMPQCYCPKGRDYFDPKSAPMTDWAPNTDHHPTPRAAGGKLTPDNVRLSHVFCNNTAYGWRQRIKAMLERGKSLDQIADELNLKKVPRPHGRPTWTASDVREVFVS
jgi:hypothetical protein